MVGEEGLCFSAVDSGKIKFPSFPFLSDSVPRSLRPRDAVPLAACFVGISGDWGFHLWSVCASLFHASSVQVARILFCFMRD